RLRQTSARGPLCRSGHAPRSRSGGRSHAHGDERHGGHDDGALRAVRRQRRDPSDLRTASAGRGARRRGGYDRRRPGRDRAVRVGYNSKTFMAFENLLIERDGAVVVLTVNRPKVLNALNAPTLDELRRAVLEVKSNEEVRVLVVTGAGDKAFVAGADINELAVQSP